MGWLDELKSELENNAGRRAAAKKQYGTKHLADFEARAAEARRAPTPHFHRVDEKAQRQVPPAHSDHYAGQCWRCGSRLDHGCAHHKGNG